MNNSIERDTYRVAYLDYSIPSLLTASVICRAMIHVRNEGALRWMRTPIDDGNPVTLALWINGTVAGTFELPVECVAPGESAAFPIEFVVPELQGRVLLKFDMVHQNVTLFESKGADILMVRPEVMSNEKSREAGIDGQSPAERIAVYAAHFLDFRIPEFVRPGERFGIWLSIQNQGTLTWAIDPASGRRVRVSVRIDGDFVAGSDLPQSVVPFNNIDIHMTVPSPLTPGRHNLQVDLVHEEVGFFSDFGSQTLLREIVVGKGRQPAGSLLFETALRRDSWFYQPSFGIPNSSDGSAYPLFIKHASGCHIWDTEGNRYLDYTMGWGSALLGYAYPPIQKAIRRVLDCGATLPLPHPLEMEVAAKLCENIPCAEMVAFGKNGSDACNLAVRLARLNTGKNFVLTCGFHGWQDWFVEAFGFDSTGVPSRGEVLTEPFVFNDRTDFLSKLETHRKDLAAVMLEPAGASQGRQVPAEDVDREFLRTVAEKTREAGGLLIFDEIITGFRYPGGGIQKATGIVPDMACFGKALGAGMPISAVAGKADIFSSCMPRAFYGPTFKGEIYSLAAANAAMDIYRGKPVAEHVWNYGNRIKGHVDQICREMNLKAKTAGAPFRFGLTFEEPDPSRLQLLHSFYIQELMKQRIVTYNGVMLPSLAHDDAAFRETVAGIETALGRLQRADREGNLHRKLELPLSKP